MYFYTFVYFYTFPLTFEITVLYIFVINFFIMIARFINWVKAEDEYQQGERLRLIIISIACCVGLLICSDGRANEVACATVINEEYIYQRKCIDTETLEEINCTKKENAKKCHLKILETY